MGRSWKQKITAEKTKAEKIKSRSRKGTLKSNEVTPRVFRRYVVALQLLFAFWKFNQLTPTSKGEIDSAVCEFVEAQWAGGEPVYRVNDALAGLQYFLPLRKQLHSSWKRLRTWHKLEPASRVLPMHPLLIMGMASVTLQLGYLDIAALMLVGFECFLRSAEIYTLEVRDIHFYRDKAVLKLRDTKTSKRTGFDEMVLCHSVLATKLLKLACQNKKPHDTVLDSNPYMFRKLFGKSADVFGDFENLSVYSLRRGGATWNFLQHHSMELTLLKGRWASAKTARIYLQDAIAGLSDLQMSDNLRNRLLQHVAFLKEY